MQALLTRFFCATLSVVGAAGLVVSSSAVAVGGDVAKARTVVIAAAPAPLARNG